MNKFKKRIWELDFLRGLSVLGMIVFHLFFALSFFGIKDYQMFDGGWLYLGNFVRFTFIGLVGVSLGLSSSKKYSKVALHSLNIFLLALLVSLVTYIFVPENFVRFGILHFIAVGILIALPFRKFTWTNLLLAIVIFTLNFYLPRQAMPDLDYFPIIPWQSLIFLGLFLANFAKKKVAYKSRKIPLIFEPIIFLGRHSLSIYIIHIPIILAAIITLFPELWAKFF